MDLVRAVVYPSAWVLAGVTALWATIAPAWAWMALTLLAIGLVVPDILRHRRRRARLVAVGYTGRMPPGFTLASDMAPTLFLLCAMSGGVAAGTFWGMKTDTVFPQSAKDLALTLSLALAVLALALLGALLLAERQGLDRLARLRQWQVRRTDDAVCDTLAKLEPVSLGLTPRGPGIHGAGPTRYQHQAGPVVSGRLVGNGFHLFDYTYRTWSANGTKSSPLDMRRHRVLAITLSDEAPDLRIHSLDDRLTRAGGPPDVPLAQSAFSAQFSVRCEDAEFAYRWMTQGVVDALLGLGPETSMHWNGNILTLFQPGRLTPLDGLVLATAGRQILRMMPLGSHPPKEFVVAGTPVEPTRRAFHRTDARFDVTSGPRRDM